MSSNKGFSLIELIITVGIIGILSLLALPVYQDYVTKVKLTEVGLKHMYLTKQIEIEYNSEGPIAVYGLLRGLCATGISESISETGGYLQCATSDNRMLTVSATVGSVSIGLYPDMTALRDPKLEYTMQSFYLTDTVYEAAIQYSFADRPIKGSIRDLYTFDFRKVQGDKTFKINHKDGAVTDFEDGKWYCAVSFQNSWVDYEIVRRSIRPSMCNYYAYGFNQEGIFYEY